MARKKELTFKEKKEYYNLALSIAGVRFDNPDIIDLLITVYDRMLEMNGAVGVDELVKLRDEFLEKSKPNEPTGKKED